MNDNRLHVLQMLAAGQVSAEEAERLLGALDRESAAPATRTAAGPRYLRVIVQARDSGGGDGDTNVNIRVPFQLLRAGVRLTSLIPDGAKGQINEALRKNGVPVDVTQLRPDDLDELVVHLAEVTVEVEEKDSTVRVFAE